MVNLGDIFPNFQAQTNEGPIKFHEFLGERFVHQAQIYKLFQNVANDALCQLIIMVG